MKWLVSYDNWVRGRVKAVLDWLAEWLSITQKTVEKTLIAIYAIGAIGIICASPFQKKHAPMWILVLAEIWMVSVLVASYREPSAIRTRKYGSAMSIPLRLMWQWIAVWVFLPPYQSTVMDISVGVANISFAIMVHIISVNSDGERGRKRKLAWSKLKELFSWLPDPVPEGV